MINNQNNSQHTWKKKKLFDEDDGLDKQLPPKKLPTSIGPISDNIV